MISGQGIGWTIDRKSASSPAAWINVSQAKATQITAEHVQSIIGTIPQVSEGQSPSLT